jgi:hypothetical protein
VNFSTTKFRTRWLVFHEKVQTSAVFLRDTTPVTPYTLLLFGGNIQVAHNTGVVTIDKWIAFAAQVHTYFTVNFFVCSVLNGSVFSFSNDL